MKRSWSGANWRPVFAAREPSDRKSPPAGATRLGMFDEDAVAWKRWAMPWLDIRAAELSRQLAGSPSRGGAPVSRSGC